MPIRRNMVNREAFNPDADLPYELRIDDIALAMQDMYDFFYDTNKHLRSKGLQRLEEMLRPQTLTGIISDSIATALAKHSRVLVDNQRHNGHPDLLVQGVYENNSVQNGEEGVEVKSTLKRGGQVDFHAARDQWLCIFVYMIDKVTEPIDDRAPLKFTEVYLGQVLAASFRHNPRGERGTRTASVGGAGMKELRKTWVYLDRPPQVPRVRKVRVAPKPSVAKASEVSKAAKRAIAKRATST